MTVFPQFDEPSWVADYYATRRGGEQLPRFELTRFRNITLGTTASYLIKGLIPRVGITAVYGPPKCAKTFWLFDALMHVAMGWDYRSRRVRSGTVVYCAFEGAEGFKARKEAFRIDRLNADDDPPFHLVAARMSFVRDHGDLIASIRSELAGEQPAAIVLDTMRRSLAGSDSDDKDVSAYIEAADAVRECFDTAVIIVHHSGLEAGRPRGSTALAGAVDALLSCSKDDSGLVTVEVQLMKDGPEGECVASRLRQIEVGIDEDGDPITSLVVDAAEPEPALSSKAVKAARMPKGAKIALDALAEAIDAHGTAPPAGVGEIPASIQKTVSRHQWRAFAQKRGISTSDKESAVRMALDRASAYLVAERNIGVWDDHVWPV